MAYKNDTNSRDIVGWSSARNSEDRLSARPHIVNTANNRANGNVRYFSSIDADIYFGDQFIDEVTSINWQVQQNVLPIIGYNSYTFDALAVGSRMVSGQFSVNFTKANYLGEVLNVMTKVSRNAYGKDNPVKSNVYTDADGIRTHTPVWDAGFDIVVGYGGTSDGTSYEQNITLECCQLMGCAQGLDPSGEPIQEIYTFIAKDIRYGTPRKGGNETVTQDSSGSNKVVSNKVDKDKNPNILELKEGTIDLSSNVGAINIPYSILSSHLIESAKIKIRDVKDVRTSWDFSEIEGGALAVKIDSKAAAKIKSFTDDNNFKKVYADAHLVYSNEDGKEYSVNLVATLSVK